MANESNKNSTLEQGRDKAERIYQQAKDSASKVYEEGKEKVEEVHGYLEEHADDLIKAVKEKPVTSLLVAGGIGFLLAALLKK